MSRKLSMALRASMESDEVVAADAIDQAIEENNSIDLTGPSPADLRDQIESTNNIIEVLDDIGIAASVVKVPEADGTIVNPEVEGVVVESNDVAQGAPVSMEALAYTLQTVLRSHGVSISSASLESGNGQDQGQKVSELAFTTAANMRKHVSVTLESATSDMRGTINQKASAIAKTKAALNQAISKINASSKAIDQSPITLTHRGINQFLFRDEAPVLELKGAMKPDLEAMSKLKDIVKQMANTYDHLYTNDKALDESDVKKFIAGLAMLHTGKLFNGLDGVTLLHGGTLVRLDDEDTPYVVCEYNKDTNDGNALQRHASKIGAVAGVVIGGAIGSAVGGGMGIGAGAAVGVWSGLAAGKALGEIGNGKNTHSTNTPADLVAFLKDALAMCDMVQGVGDLLSNVEASDKRARNYANVLITSLSNNDNMKVIGVNVLVGVLSAVVAHKTGRSIGAGGNVMETEAERVRGTMFRLIDGNYEGYHSVACTLIDHVFICVDAAAKIAKNVIDNV
jgi:hypothetical protein